MSVAGPASAPGHPIDFAQSVKGCERTANRRASSIRPGGGKPVMNMNASLAHASLDPHWTVQAQSSRPPAKTAQSLASGGPSG